MCQLSVVQDAGANLLKVRATQHDKFSLALMDALFTDSEMGMCCYAGTKRSTKMPLSQEKNKSFTRYMNALSVHIYVYCYKLSP